VHIYILDDLISGRHRCNQCTYTVERQHILDYHIKIVHNGAGAPGGAIPASGSDACSMPSAPASPQLSDGENGVDRRALDEDMSTDDRAQPLTNTEQNSKAETDQDASDDVTKANQSSGPEQGDKQRARDDWPTKPPMPRASVGRSCIRCGFVSRSEAAAVRHRLTGHSGLEYFCGDGGKCDRRATTSRLLAAHRARTHQSQQQQLQVDSSGSGESKTAPGSGIGGTYACSECPYRSSSPSHVASHGRLHVPPDRPHRCPECTYSVDRRSLLGQHIRLHQQQQQQQQPQDDKQQRDTRETVASSSSSAEDKQKQTPRRLRCSECPFRCRSAGQLSRHRQRHATVREGRLKSMPATGCSYKCEQCSFCADVRNAIAHHRLLHGVEGRRHKQTTAARRRR
jgi:hypothetical protein